MLLSNFIIDTTTNSNTVPTAPSVASPTVPLVGNALTLVAGKFLKKLNNQQVLFIETLTYNCSLFQIMPVGALSQTSTSKNGDAEVSNRNVAPVEKVSAKEKKKGSYVCPFFVVYVYIVVVMV